MFTKPEDWRGNPWRLSRRGVECEDALFEIDAGVTSGAFGGEVLRNDETSRWVGVFIRSICTGKIACEHEAQPQPCAASLHTLARLDQHCCECAVCCTPKAVE